MSDTRLPTHRFDLAVIIPVEYHRDQAVECVRGWATEQQHPAERYQLILCAPSTLEATTEAQIRALLRPWDRLEKRPADHDMTLVAEAARLAESDLLLFTESHCLPYAHAVNSIVTAAAEHPQWSGFSCTTTPQTHGMLSEIEANTYDTHIRKGVGSSGWMKVIDQCFVIRRRTYFAAGGFRPAFGHFAEWLLAAELHRLGETIGLYPHDLLQHYYSGVAKDLEEFTFDFARGHIQYLAECGDEPTARYFPELPELQAYRQRSQADYRWLALTKTKALPRILLHLLRLTRRRQAHVPFFAVLTDWLQSLVLGVSAHCARGMAMASVHVAKRRLNTALGNADRVQGSAEFLDWFAKLSHLSRLTYLANRPSLRGSARKATDYPPAQTVDWSTAAREDTQIEWLGLYDGEQPPAGQRLRWSKPTTCLWLPLHAGKQRIVIDWDATRPLPPAELLQVHFAGRSLAATAVTLTPQRLTLEVVATTQGWHRLDWSVTPFLAHHDRRLLGLPLQKIHWSQAPQDTADHA